MFKSNLKYEILTPSGFQDFDGIQTVSKNHSLSIILENKKEIICSLSHRFLTEEDGYVEAQYLAVGDILRTRVSLVSIKDIKYNNEPITLYDPINVDGGNCYISEEVISHNCEFLGTGDTYVEGSILKNMYDFVKREDNEKHHKYLNRMYIWEEPLPQYTYMICIDTGLGREYDYSAFHIIKLETGEQVAEFYSNKTPVNEFASILVDEGQLYNTAFLVPERNTIGNNLIEWLFDIYEYENVWIDPEDGKMGVQITQVKRETVLAKMEEYIRTGVYKINSQRTVNELLTFIIDDRNRAVADEGSHDDLVMSLAIGAYAMEKIVESTPLEMSQIPHQDRKMLEPMRAVNVEAYGGMTQEDITWLLGK